MAMTGYDSRHRVWLRSLNCDGAYGWALAAGLVLLFMLALGGETWRQALQYERGEIAAGEWWRLASAHLVHLGLHHLLLDAAGLVLLWILHARSCSLAGWVGVFILSGLAVDAGLWWLSPDVEWYVGLSGVLHGFWAAGALGAWRGQRLLAVMSLSLLGGKLAMEQWLQASTLGGGLPVIIDAHLYGAVGGVLAALVLGHRWRRL